MRNILYQIIREEDKHLLNQKGVYQIKNKENNKVYIGSTSIKFSNRLRNHIRELVENRHHSIHLQNSFNKEKNFEKFEILILEICESGKCLESEQKWIDLYQSHNQKFGYNISPTAGSCFGIKKTKDEKIKTFERLRKLTDEQVIEIFNLRNNMRFNNSEISIKLNISKNQIVSILTKPEKYKYVKEKYNLQLETKHEKKFTKDDIKLIHEFYENQKLSIREISEITGFEFIPLRHLICRKDLYITEKDGLIFNVEKNRKSKFRKINRKKGIKINKKILSKEIIINIFELKYIQSLTIEEISKMIFISLKEIDLILSFRYQRRKYSNLYKELKSKYDLRERRNILTENDIKDIFNDYHSGKYLVEELNKKYNFHDVSIFFSNKRLSKYYQEILDKNNLIVNKKKTKNLTLKSKSMIDKNKQRSKSYKLIDPSGNEFIIKNLTEFCKDKKLDAANLSRISKNGKTHKGWKCECLD
jgi:hypothetical protein